MSSSPFRGILWHTLGKSWHRRPSACRQRFSRRRRHSRHSTWHNIRRREPTSYFDVRTASRTFCSSQHNPRSNACTRSGPFFRQRRAMRNDESMHRTQRHKLNRLLHTSSYARRADCLRLLPRRRFLKASPKQSYPWRSSCKTYSSSFDPNSTLPDHSRRQHTLVDHRPFPVSESPGPHTGAVETSIRINVPLTLWRQDRPNYIVFATRASVRRIVIHSKKADAAKSFNDSTTSASLSARIANNKKSRHSELPEGFHHVGLLINSPVKIF